MWHHVDGPHFGNPSSVHGHLGCSNFFSCYEWCCSEHGHANISARPCPRFFWNIPGSGIAESCDYSVLILWVTSVLCSPAIACSFPGSPHCCQQLLLAVVVPWPSHWVRGGISLWFWLVFSWGFMMLSTFSWLLGHMHNVCGEMSVQVLCPFLRWVVWFFVLEF